MILIKTVSVGSAVNKKGIDKDKFLEELSSMSKADSYEFFNNIIQDKKNLMKNRGKGSHTIYKIPNMQYTFSLPSGLPTKKKYFYLSSYIPKKLITLLHNYSVIKKDVLADIKPFYALNEKQSEVRSFAQKEHKNKREEKIRQLNVSHKIRMGIDQIESGFNLYLKNINPEDVSVEQFNNMFKEAKDFLDKINIDNEDIQSIVESKKRQLHEYIANNLLEKIRKYNGIDLVLIDDISLFMSHASDFQKEQFNIFIQRLIDNFINTRKTTSLQKNYKDDMRVIFLKKLALVMAENPKLVSDINITLSAILTPYMKFYFAELSKKVTAKNVKLIELLIYERNKFNNKSLEFRIPNLSKELDLYFIESEEKKQQDSLSTLIHLSSLLAEHYLTKKKTKDATICLLKATKLISKLDFEIIANDEKHIDHHFLRLQSFFTTLGYMYQKFTSLPILDTQNMLKNLSEAKFQNLFLVSQELPGKHFDVVFNLFRIIMFSFNGLNEMSLKNFSPISSSFSDISNKLLQIQSPTTREKELSINLYVSTKVRYMSLMYNLEKDIKTMNKFAFSPILFKILNKKIHINTCYQSNSISNHKDLELEHEFCFTLVNYIFVKNNIMKKMVENLTRCQKELHSKEKFNYIMDSSLVESCERICMHRDSRLLLNRDVLLAGIENIDRHVNNAKDYADKLLTSLPKPASRKKKSSGVSKNAETARSFLIAVTNELKLGA